MRKFLVLAAALAAFAGATPAAADYPTKPITLIIGFAPGGPSDVMARLLTKKMEEVLKQPFIIENKPGAAGGLPVRWWRARRRTGTPCCSPPERSWRSI